MTDIELDRLVDRPAATSPSAFWLYLVLSLAAHFAIFTWLLPAGFPSSGAAPAIMVRLSNPGETGEAGGGGGGGPIADNALQQKEKTIGPSPPAPPARLPVPKLEEKPERTVSPVKRSEPTSVAEVAMMGPAQDPAPVVENGDVGSGSFSSGDGGEGEGSGGGRGGGNGSGIGPGVGPGVGEGDGPGGPGRVGLPTSYYRQLHARILRNRHYPLSCRENRTEGTVKVRFILYPDGKATDIRVVKSSGSDELDRAGLAAIEHTQFPPFPAGINLPPQIITVPVHFELQ